MLGHPFHPHDPFPAVSGIYEIRNKINGKRYIGSAKNFSIRWWLHLKNLREGEHHSEILQRAWNKYGEEAFEFRILVLVEKCHLLEIEQIYLDGARPAYNIAPNAGSRLGMKIKPESLKRRMETLQRPEVQAKLGSGMRGKPKSEEWKALMRERMKGNTNGRANKGRTLSEEHMQKFQEGRRRYGH